MVAVRGKQPIAHGWDSAEPLLGPLPEGADGVAVRLGHWERGALFAVNSDDRDLLATSITLVTPGKIVAVWSTPRGSTVLYAGRTLPPIKRVEGRRFVVMARGIVVAPPSPGYNLIED